MNAWEIKTIPTCQHCGGRLERKSNQTGHWWECLKCGRIIEWDEQLKRYVT